MVPEAPPGAILEVRPLAGARLWLPLGLSAQQVRRRYWLLIPMSLAALLTPLLVCAGVAGLVWTASLWALGLAGVPLGLLLGAGLGGGVGMRRWQHMLAGLDTLERCLGLVQEQVQIQPGGLCLIQERREIRLSYTDIRALDAETGVLHLASGELLLLAPGSTPVARAWALAWVQQALDRVTHGGSPDDIPPALLALRAREEA